MFVGNISEKASDTLVRQILLVSLISLSPSTSVTNALSLSSIISQRCGRIEGWKRVQDALGKLQGTTADCHERLTYIVKPS